jgi:phosphatidylglycerol---prolipoprotein diacylglyceryl transferase
LRTMLPYHSFISWKLGPITIQSFGLMMAIGFLIAAYLFGKQFKDARDKEHAYNLAIISVVAGVIGSRILFFFENPAQLTGLMEFFRFWDGGLSWFGGFIGALIGFAAYVLLNKLNFMRMADKIAPSIAIGHAFGRIGCILGDGGHVGKITTMPWGFDVDGEIRHVTAWYELIGLLALFVTLLALRKRKPYDGFLFHFYLIGYGLIRFVSDFFRTEPTYYGLTVAQYFSIGLFLAGVAMMAVSLVRQNKLRKIGTATAALGAGTKKSKHAQKHG